MFRASRDFFSALLLHSIKGQVHSVLSHDAIVREYRYSLIISLTALLDEGGCQRHAPVKLLWEWPGRFQLKCDDTRWRTGGEVKGKLANGVDSQYPSHYLGTWCIQHYYRWYITAASSRLKWRPRLFKWTRPFRRKTKSGFCTCAITFQTQSTHCVGGWVGRSGSVRKISPPTGIHSVDCLARSEWLYRLSYPGPQSIKCSPKLWNISVKIELEIASWEVQVVTWMTMGSALEVMWVISVM